VSDCFKKIAEKRKLERLFMLASDDVISVRIQTSSLFILEDGVKFNIWDVVSYINALTDESNAISNETYPVYDVRDSEDFRRLSKNKTSKFQHFVILFINLCYPHTFALYLTVRNCFFSLSVKTFTYHL